MSASTQNQALNALIFLYRTVLHQELDYPIDSVRAKPSQHLPEVLTKDEARQVIAQMSGIYQLQAKLLYGSGLRLLECLRLRVKDLDFDRRAIIVRDTKGNKDRVTMLPDSVVEPLKEHLLRVRRLHQEDLAKGGGAYTCPMPWIGNSPTRRTWIWQYVFPSEQLSQDPRSCDDGRHHLDEAACNAPSARAAHAAGLDQTRHLPQVPPQRHHDYTLEITTTSRRGVQKDLGYRSHNHLGDSNPPRGPRRRIEARSTPASIPRR